MQALRTTNSSWRMNLGLKFDTSSNWEPDDKSINAINRIYEIKSIDEFVWHKLELEI